MKILLSWLHEFLPITPSADEVAQALTTLGIEVAQVKDQSQGLGNVVVAKIVEFTKHPDADRLSLCKVTDGTEIFDIVCGAKNFKAGDHVALAKIGAKLPNGMEIKKSKIRGATSLGMLCSEEELGFKEHAEGILILPSDSPLGVGLAEYMGKTDALLELELTPNRGDCLSVIGIAQEVAAYFKVAPKILSLGNVKGSTVGNIQAVVLDSDAAPRYSLQKFDSIEVSPSIPKISGRVESCGTRSLSSVVDITNYVMLERGQPLHAFDADKVVGTVEVRMAKENESIVCLDDVERKLTSQDLIIADKDGPIAIAGIMGGKRTAVSLETKSILLESAHFAPTNVRKTSKRLGLHTESSHRFERFVDPSGVWSASKRAAELLEEFCKARQIASVELDKNSSKPAKIRLRKNAIVRYLGQEVKEAGDYLTKLGFSLEKIEEDYWVEVPTRRQDVTREIDLIEEIARLHGYANFKSKVSSQSNAVNMEDSFSTIRNFLNFTSSMGFREIRTYSFVSAESNRTFRFQKNATPLKMINGFTESMQEMRGSLVPNLIDAWKLNSDRQAPCTKLFELAKVYSASDGSQSTPVNESLHLGMLVGGKNTQTWQIESRSVDFFDLKGAVEAFSENFHLKLTFAVPKEPWSFLHPGKSAEVFYRNQTIGYVGALHPAVSKKMELEEAFIAELKLDSLLSQATHTTKVKPFSVFPCSQRDLAFVVSDELPSARILQEVDSLKLPYLNSVKLFDVYQGKGVPNGFKSLAFTFTFSSLEKTLTEEEVAADVEKIVQRVSSACGAQLRS